MAGRADAHQGAWSVFVIPFAHGPYAVSSSPLLTQLIEALRVLPGVGNKTAQRMAFHLLERDRDGARRLAGRLVEASERIGNCARCRTFSEDTVCPLCASTARDDSLLCVVESPV